jgi:hypothetical protein
VLNINKFSPCEGLQYVLVGGILALLFSRFSFFTFFKKKFLHILFVLCGLPAKKEVTLLAQLNKNLKITR